MVELLPGMPGFASGFRAYLGLEIFSYLNDLFLAFCLFIRGLSAKLPVDSNCFPPMSLVEKQLCHGFSLNRRG